MATLDTLPLPLLPDPPRAGTSSCCTWRVTVVVAWCLSVAAGFGGLMWYSQQPGDADAPPATWPSHSALPIAARQRILVMFVHPHCPCSRASLEELASIVDACPDPLQTLVVFVRPKSLDAGWESGRLWKQVAEIPSVQRLVDPAGREAELFGAKTSGQTYLYDASGKLHFSGGITAFRGHAGDNRGRQAVERVLQGQPAKRTHCIYGCPLLNPSRSSQERLSGTLP
jgi:hypothetical protein